MLLVRRSVIDIYILRESVCLRACVCVCLSVRGGRRGRPQNRAPHTGSVRGRPAGDRPPTGGGGVLNITAAVWTAGFHWWRSGNKKRMQNVSEYMPVCLVRLCYGIGLLQTWLCRVMNSERYLLSAAHKHCSYCCCYYYSWFLFSLPSFPYLLPFGPVARKQTLESCGACFCRLDAIPVTQPAASEHWLIE